MIFELRYFKLYCNANISMKGYYLLDGLAIARSVKGKTKVLQTQETMLDRVTQLLLNLKGEVGADIRVQKQMHDKYKTDFCNLRDRKESLVALKDNIVHLKSSLNEAKTQSLVLRNKVGSYEQVFFL